MLPTTIRSPPAVDDFVPLTEYQSQTPETFIGGKPVLHLHLTNAKATVPSAQGRKLAIFPSDTASAQDDGTNGSSTDNSERQVEVFVTSE
jgi:chloride channel, nucleotide-sensitive, 1A